LVLGVAVAALVVVGAPARADVPPNAEPVQILAINDFHGRIARTVDDESTLATGPGPDGVFGADATGQSDDVFDQVGGSMHVGTLVEDLQVSFRRDAAGSAASFLVGAGDLIGNSTPESDPYKDEPTIEVLNAMGMDVSVVGNNEFDRGTQELRRISGATDGQYTDDVTACQGVTPGVDGCFGEGEHAFTGANFPYLAANVVSRGTGEPMLPPYQVLFTPRGVRLALIGVVFESTPSGERNVPIDPRVIADVSFLDEAETINRYVPQLRADGIEAIGVLVHLGGERGPTARDPNGCDQLTGQILGLNERIDPAVDFVVSGHTHDVYNCMLSVPGGEPRIVTQAGAYGQLVTDIRLTLDRQTGDVDRAATYSATNVPVTRAAPHAQIQAIVDYWLAGPGSEGAGEATDPRFRESATEGSPIAAYVLVGSVILAGVVATTVVAWQRSRRSPGGRDRSVEGEDGSVDDENHSGRDGTGRHRPGGAPAEHSAPTSDPPRP
jgi:5'-nucleotidase